MIRFSNEKDILQIVSLWSEAFGDGEKEIRFFLDEWYKPQNTLVCELNGEVVSMLFLLEGSFCFEGQKSQKTGRSSSFQKKRRTC